MLKYIHKTNSSDIHYFEKDVSVGDWLDLSNYRLMTKSEILKHETPRPSEFHNLWNGFEWLDNRTEQEILLAQRKQMPTLTPIEFDLKLAKYDLYDGIQTLIAANLQLKIAYTRATFFSRTDPFVDQARIILGLSNKQVDEMWTS